MAHDTSIEYLIKFGHHLQILRKSKDLSLRKLAAKCNIEHSDIVRYEKGEINISFNSLVELSKGLEISLKELMDFEI
jgi:transcriptional regulator with XRE-family HTH domain